MRGSPLKIIEWYGPSIWEMVRPGEGREELTWFHHHLLWHTVVSCLMVTPGSFITTPSSPGIVSSSGSRPCACPPRPPDHCNSQMEPEIKGPPDLEPAPAETRAGELFVPTTIRPDVLAWGPSSPIAGHPGPRRSLTYLQRAFWWPCMTQDVCQVYTRGKTTNQPTLGKLQPLPVPYRP